MSPSTSTIDVMVTNGFDASTDAQANEAESDRHALPFEMIGLVVLWARDAPNRVGEVLLLPPGEPGPFGFGRGEAQGGYRRVGLARQVPGALVPQEALACSRISREQLRLSPVDNGLLVENVGSCPLVHAGREVARVELLPGETIALKNEILFLCVRRAPMASLPGGFDVASHAFGMPDPFGIVGESPAVWDLRQRLVAVARQPFHVLILGESGSGKELVAQAIHARSARGERLMVSRNAATIPEGLADAELFGNLRGYPNPGMPQRPGLVGQADGSTLFLDEFAELQPSVQAHLLRVLDAGEYQRLGEAIVRRTDLRVVAATNRTLEDIKHDVAARFKVRVVVPSLNARREDIPLLSGHLLRAHAAGHDSGARRFFPEGRPEGMPRVSPVLMEALVQHAYTTNVRELEAFLVSAALGSHGRYLELGPELQRDLHAGRTWSTPAPPAAKGLADLTQEERQRLSLLRKHHFSPTACGRDAAYPGNRQTADLHLRQLLCRALRAADWDVRRAADFMAGQAQPEVRERCAARIAKFLANLRERVESEPPEELRRALVEEWKNGAEGVLLVVEALREGRICGA